MITKTINLTQVKRNPQDALGCLSNSSSREVIQINHRGNTPKIVLTQEHYFQLLSNQKQNAVGKSISQPSTPVIEEEKPLTVKQVIARKQSFQTLAHNLNDSDEEGWAKVREKFGFRPGTPLTEMWAQLKDEITDAREQELGFLD